MVLINLSTNSYKFTIKGKIIFRGVSMPKEKKLELWQNIVEKDLILMNLKKTDIFMFMKKSRIKCRWFWSGPDYSNIVIAFIIVLYIHFLEIKDIFLFFKFLIIIIFFIII